MASTFPLERVRHYVLPAVAALVGLGVAIGIATVPSDVLNAAVDRGGFSDVLPAAASPIGTTGRTILALVAGALIAACGFVPQAKAWLLDRADAFARKPRASARASGEKEHAPVIRRADAHPDAPPRRPIRAASDLGDPLPIFGEEDHRSAPLPPPVEQPLPADLDRPLADFDPAAVPLRPMAPPEPISPLSRRAREMEEASAPRFAWLAREEDESAAWVGDADAPGVTAHDASGDGDAALAHEPHPSWTAEIEQASPVESTPKRSATFPPPDARPLAEPAAESNSAPALHAAASGPRGTMPPRLVARPADIGVPPVAGEDDDSIAGLLARLERGAAQRRIVARPAAAPAPTPAPAPQADSSGSAEPQPTSLDDTLQRLRRLAAG